MAEPHQVLAAAPPSSSSPSSSVPPPGNVAKSADFAPIAAASHAASLTGTSDGDVRAPCSRAPSASSQLSLRVFAPVFGSAVLRPPASHQFPSHGDTRAPEGCALGSKRGRVNDGAAAADRAVLAQEDAALERRVGLRAAPLHPRGPNADAAAFDSPLGKYVDHYLSRAACFDVHHCVRLSLVELLLPCHLVCAALCVHAQRSRQPPPPFPPGAQLQFRPLQLQRFLRSCVLATAHALVTPPASVFRLVHARTKSRWIERIFVRVMSDFVARAMVRRQATRCARACRATLARLSFASSHGSAITLLTHSAANAGGYPGTMAGDALASAALPNAVLLHAHALLVCRLLPKPALQAKAAFIKRRSEATWLPCKII
jgi:hypothetical protein